MRTIFRVAVIAYVTYLALALLVITPALNFLPHKYVKDAWGRQLQTGWVLFNPFTVSLDVRDAELSGAAGERFLAFSDASIDLSMSSLWQPGWVLDRVYLRDLHAELTRLQPDQYNFSDLLGDGSDSEPASAPADASSADDDALPRVTVHDVDLHSAAIIVTDQARETPHTSRWNNLHVRLGNVSTVLEAAGPFSVEVQAEDGGRLDWQGDLSVAQAQSSGRFSLADLDLVNAWRFARPWLAFELKSGRLSALGEYDLNWKGEPHYRVSGGRVALAGLDIAPLDTAQLPDTWVRLRSLDIDGVALDSATANVAIDTATLDALDAATWREGSTVSLQPLFAVTLEESSATPEEGGLPWTVTLRKAQLHNGSLHWRSEYTDPPELLITPIEASLEHLTWPLSGDTRLSLTLAANQHTQITVDGTLALAAGDGSLEYALKDLPLAWFNPTLPKPLKATITGGQLGVAGNAALRDFAPTAVALDVKIRDFSARQEEAEETLTSFDLLHLEGVTVDMAEHTLALRKVIVDTYTGRLHIRKDGSINATNIWKQEVGDEAQAIAEELTEDRPWRFSLPLIRISDSAIDFTDESLPIQFRTVIGDLEGEVHDLDSGTAAAARVDITGTVDGYAPVSLKGEIAPLASPIDLDLRLTFDGVDMALLSPYAGTYAGYKIDRGLLDLDLHYSLADNKLQGDNSIRIEKLKLGDKTGSDKALDLPLQLALAILTDSNGVIDLAVPVKGDVDNPQFDLGAVISKAFLNLIKKAVTAPFTLLAGLANSEDDLQRINFNAGSSTLRTKSKEKLRELGTALSQRPQLSLVITGRLNLETDRARLQRDALTARLLADGLSAEEIKAKGPDWEEMIAELYDALPDSGAAPAQPSAAEKATRVTESIAISDAQLSTLAAERARAVKLFLVTEAGLAQERAVVDQPSIKDSENTFSGAELGIGT